MTSVSSSEVQDEQVISTITLSEVENLEPCGLAGNIVIRIIIFAEIIKIVLTSIIFLRISLVQNSPLLQELQICHNLG